MRAGCTGRPSKSVGVSAQDPERREAILRIFTVGHKVWALSMVTSTKFQSDLSTKKSNAGLQSNFPQKNASVCFCLLFHTRSRRAPRRTERKDCFPSQRGRQDCRHLPVLSLFLTVAPKQHHPKGVRNVQTTPKDFILLAYLVEGARKMVAILRYRTVLFSFRRAVEKPRCPTVLAEAVPWNWRANSHRRIQQALETAPMDRSERLWLLRADWRG